MPARPLGVGAWGGGGDWGVEGRQAGAVRPSLGTCAHVMDRVTSDQVRVLPNYTRHSRAGVTWPS